MVPKKEKKRWREERERELKRWRKERESGSERGEKMPLATSSQALILSPQKRETQKNRGPVLPERLLCWSWRG